MTGLFNNHFYNRTIRKITVAFGNLFTDIQMVRYNKAGDTELERVLVPIVYGQKERFMLRTHQDPDLTRSIQIQLPRLSFEFLGLQYDSSRKLGSLLTNISEDGTKLQYKGIPYDFSYSLTLYVKNIEDGNQIVEQILPAFNPDYTLSLLLDGMDKPIDVPISLNSTQFSATDESSSEEMRIVMWSFDFTVKGYIYGPVTASGGLILKANTYFYNNYSPKETITALVVEPGGIGTFKDTEYVYQGDVFDEATSKAEVVDFDDLNNKLYVKNLTLKPFVVGDVIRGRDTGAAYNLASYYVTTNALAMSYITPNPASANTANQSNGFIIQIKEAPRIP